MAGREAYAEFFDESGSNFRIVYMAIAGYHL